ncbi:MAG: hypothetical protein ACKVJG_11600 [Candidatus Latescibacterota bacterium]
MRKKSFILNSFSGRNYSYNLLKSIHKDVDRQAKSLLKAALLKNDLPELQKDLGFAIWPSSAVAACDQLVQDSRNIFQTAQVDKIKSAKEYLRNIPLDEYMTSDSPFIKFALDPGLLSVVSRYLNTAPILQEIYMRYSPNEKMQGGSQFYHLDKEDVRSVKVFVFIEDCMIDGGALTAISAKTSERVIQQILGRWRNVGRLSDEAVSKNIEENEAVPIYGPAGTIGLLDVTCCLHFGSRPSKKTRLVVWFLFHSRLATQFPFSLQGGVRFPFHTLIKDDMNELQRYVLT